MQRQDRDEKERLDNRNALEEYIYELRQQLDNDLNVFVDPEEKNSILGALRSLEDWIYDDGCDEKKEVYIGKLTELTVSSDI